MNKRQKKKQRKKRRARMMSLITMTIKDMPIGMWREAFSGCDYDVIGRLWGRNEQATKKKEA